MTHGSAHAYIELKCRCAECKEANRVRASVRRRKQIYGIYQNSYIPAEPARQHCLDLAAKGWGTRTIAEKSGVSLTVIKHLLYGRSPAEQTSSRYGRPAITTRILARNAEKIMAVRFSLEDSSGGVLVDSLGLIRRVQALACLGYSMNWQAEALGITPGNFALMLKRNRVSASTWHKVNDLFVKYHLVKRVASNRHEQAGITKALNQAKKNKWVPPLMWDNIDLDASPAVIEYEPTVDDVLLYDLVAGKATSVPRGEKKIYADALLKHGLSANATMKLLKMSGATLKGN